MGNDYYNTSDLTVIRKKLRNTATKHEKIVWKYLKGSAFMGLKFRRQHSIGRYVIDFYCNSLKIGIEIDGDTHDGEKAIEYDTIRSEYIQGAGIKIYRFTNRVVEYNIEQMLEELERLILKNNKTI